MQNAMSWFSAKPKWFRVSTYLALIYLTYALVIGVITPAILKAQLPDVISDNTGRLASVENISLNPFLLKVEVENFVIYPERTDTSDGSNATSSNAKTTTSDSNSQERSVHNSTEHFFSLGNIALDIGFWESIFTLTPAIESLIINEPYITVARLNTDDGTQTFNFSDILVHISALKKDAPAENDENESAAIPRITLDEFLLKQGHVVIEDKVTDTLLDYPELALALQDLDTHAAIKIDADVPNQTSKRETAFNQYQFNLLTAEKGKIAIHGGFQLSPIKITTDVNVTDIALKPLWSLSKDMIEAELVNGSTSLSLHAEVFEQDNAFQFVLQQGEFAINNLVFSSAASPSSINRDSNNGDKKSADEILAVPSFTVHDINVDAVQQQISIAKIAFDQVRVSGQLDQSGLDLQRLFTPKSLMGDIADDATGNKPDNAVAQASASLDEEPSARSEKEPSASLDDEPSARSEKEPSASLDEKQPANEQTTAADQEHAAQQENTDTPWQVELQQFVFANGTLDVLERSISSGTYYRVSDINFESGVITTDFSQPISYNARLHVSAGTNDFNNAPQGALSSSGSVVIDEQTFKGTASVTQLALNQFQQYVSPFANVTLEDGTFNLKVDFEGAASGALHAKASTSVSNLSVLDNAQTPLLQWQTLNVDEIEFDRELHQLNVDSIRLHAPFARLIIDEAKQTNVSKLIVATDNESAENNSALTSQDKDIAGSNSSASGSRSSASSSNASLSKEHAEHAAEASPDLAIAVNTISIEDGKAYFADHSLTPQFASAIESLNGKITGIDSRSSEPATVDITGKKDNYAPIKLAGTIHPLKSDVALDLNFSVQGAELTSINPYSGTYMGYYIDKGLLSLDVQYKLDGNQLDGKNHVVIDQLTLGKKSDSEQALSLPLGLAIALLEDRNGVIDLGLDVSGDVNSPDFSFGSIILNAIGNIITKAVTAPFSLLASLVGSDDELDKVDFAFGEHTLSPDTKDKLDTLARALKKRPGLRVNIEGTVNAISDTSALAQHQLNTELLERSGLANTLANSTNMTDGQKDNTSAQADNGSSAYTNNSIDNPATSIAGSTIPLDGPLANALLAYYTDIFTPDLTQEYNDMVAQLYPQHNASNEEQDAKGSDKSAVETNGEKKDEEQIQRALIIARYNKLRNNINIPESDLVILADARSKAVKNYLANNAEIEANRLFLLNTQHDLHTEFSGVELTLEAN